MYISSHHLDTRRNRQGFALIATISVMVLLVMVALAMLSLSSLEARSTQLSTHQAIARANARLALMQAINELQKHTGPDQRVTARAAILETGTTTLANRNWLGVWSTTVESGDEDWPVIGKAPSSGSNTTPYSRPGAYEDLRHTQADLTGGAWKTQLHRRWLVSQRSGTVDVTQALDETDGNVIEIIGKGTLGKALSGIDYDRERVLVQKVDVGDTGAYAWHIADNNQKASIDPLAEVDLVDAAFEASPRANPALVKSDNGTPFSGFTEDAQKHPGKLLTYLTAPLTQGDSDAMKELLGKHYNHFTTYSPGLFTNTLEGGLRHDLTPLLLANKGDKKVDFSISQGGKTKTFSSSYPIIPGPDHGVLGPSFGALRNWAQHAYSTSANAETTAPSSAIRMRPTDHWPHGISDGAAFDAKEWAESAPKIHPVMTDCRWHYYFSHHNSRIRTHIIPRVCLWNPYNRELRTPALTVLMPNPFFGLKNGVHFIPDESYVDDLKEKYERDSGHPFSKWIKKKKYVDDNGGIIAVYKMLTNPFPAVRYLAFTLEPTTLLPGECHVFFSKVNSASLQSPDVKVQKYEPDLVSSNTLSSAPSLGAIQGVDHFYYDPPASRRYEIQTSSSGETKLTDDHLLELDFSRILDYQPEISISTDGKVESFPFILKAGASSTLSQLYTSKDHPTLQLINNAAGGAHATASFVIPGYLWGSARQEDNGFGSLETFDEAPDKDAPDTHQFGAKLLWLNESLTEANRPPLRFGTSSTTRWVPGHMAFNPCPIANWNVRAQLQTRSPVSQGAKRYHLNSLGAWLLQFAPHSPRYFPDLPQPNRNGTALVKNPFGVATDFSFSPQVILFDLPSEDYGVISLAKLRHALLSPYSWTPSYIVGHSLRDLHAPSDHSAHEIAVSPYSKSAPPTRWDYLLGGYKISGIDHGPEAEEVDSQGLLQIGTQAVTRSVNSSPLSSENEVLAYDIAYEVNHSLWDRYFISGMPLAQNTQSFAWNASLNKPLWNRRYQFNASSGLSQTHAEQLLASSDGLNNAYWRNAEILKNKSAFNINSTSVEAWTAFLSGTLGQKRPLKNDELAPDIISFSRYQRPTSAGDTSDADPDSDTAGAWIGGRRISHEDLLKLAENIVAEIRKRGPFISIADFVNRRLTDDGDVTSHMGTLDAAIMASELNKNFEANEEYKSTAINKGSDSRSEDNNLDVFKDSYWDSSGKTSQPVSQAWGLPGFLTQGDLLEPLAPSISVRGDTFTIRAYGESSENGVVKVRAWLEATVERTPRYVGVKTEGSTAAVGNAPSDQLLIVEHHTGRYTTGDLTEVNKRFGRQFIITSIRWLNPKEI